MKKNPFIVGENVVYCPSIRGRGLLVMTNLADLVPSQEYIIIQIENEEYLVLEGFENSIPNSVHWSEFNSTK